MFTVQDALQMDVLASARLVAGEAGAGRPIRWVHIVDIPDVAQWVKGGELLLTTGIAFYRGFEPGAELIRSLDSKNLAGLCMAVGRYFQRVPASLIEPADALGFPLIELPWDIRFVDITEALHRRIIEENTEALTRCFEIHQHLSHLVLSGGGLQELARSLSQLMERAVVIEDTSFQVLASATVGEVDLATERSVRLGETPILLAKKLVCRGLMDELAQIRRPMLVSPLEEEGMTLGRLVAPIMIGHEVLAYIWVIASGRPLEELDFLAVEQAATVAALLWLKEDAVRSTEQRLRGDLVDRLLEGNPDTAMLSSSMCRFGFRPEQPYQVVLWQLPEGCDSSVQDSLPRLVGKVIQGESARSLLRHRGNELVQILQGLREEHAILRICDVLHAMSELGIEVAVGVGREHTGYDNVRDSYTEAKEAIAIAQALGDHSWPKSFTALGALRWLHRVPDVEVDDDPLMSKLEALCDYDQQHGTELLRTLESYLDHGGSFKETANDLFIHRNTLSYRLKRVEQLCGFMSGDLKRRFDLQVAVKIWTLKRRRR